MRSPSLMLLAGVTVMLVLTVGSAAEVDGEAVRSPAPRWPTAIPPVHAFTEPQPAQAPIESAFTGLQARIQQATEQAAADGATISMAVRDRATGQLISNGDAQTMAIASVAKLFIADNLLLQEFEGKTTLSEQDRTSLDAMLRSSDDGAAEQFWDRGGGDAIVTEVTRRYGLTSTVPPGDGHWWNTTSSASDLIRYYERLLDGSGGLPPALANIIVDDLATATPTGVDGYPQRFGIPDGLYAEPVAVKQGWMCCIGNDWMHLSTGVIGRDRRYIMVIESLQPGDDATARATITRAVTTMFPEGRI